MPHVRPALILTACLLIAGGAGAQGPDIGLLRVTVDRDSYRFDTAEQHGIRVDVVARGLVHPFSLAFLPNGDALVVERGVALRKVRNATGAIGDAYLEPDPVGGTPPPGGFRTAGIHEVAVHPDFASNGFVYLTYNKAGEPVADAEPGARPPVALTVLRGRLDGMRLVDVDEIFNGGERAGASGSRLAFGPNGELYVTTGAPFGSEAQEIGNVYGKVLRLNGDGTAPDDNPFATTPGARAEIYTLGHRDQLGLTVHPNGTVLAAEHGPNGGDEVNLILPGRNYGWPDYSFGRNYDGPRWSDAPLADGIEPPLILWWPSIAPTGMTFYTADRIPAWTGNLFVGSARQGQIPGTGGLERVVLNDNLEELRRESLLGGLHQRIRDVRQGPDGLLYVITDEDEAVLLRISPDG